MRRIALTLLAAPARDHIQKSLANLVAAMIEFSS
jgi:hypothetical protein